MRHFEGVRCAVSCHVVMPNHVHVVARAWEGYALEDTLQSWKRYSGRRINRLGDRGGERLWQEESFDRIVRDTSHLRRVVRYLEKNAESIGCSQRFWLRPEWEEWYRGAGCAESEFRATD
jgi:REP element-mobilizing transposase RayT